MMNLTPSVHTRSYHAINSARSDNSQAGRTVLITGGSKGIGFAIARAFAIASVTQIILAARSATALEIAVTKLKVEFRVDVSAVTCDLSDTASTQALWTELKDRGIFVDVLVLNAARVQKSESSLLGLGWQETWSLFETNVRGNLTMVEKFMGQTEPKQKCLLNVSSPFVYDQSMAVGFQSYGSSKSAMACLLQHLATETPRTKAQIISFHPGFIYSDGMREAGCTSEDLDWDDETLPANFAVWAATPKAAFLHGRFASAKWDVEELAELVKKSDSNFLRTGIHGI